MTDFNKGTWLNPPPEWQIHKGHLHLTTGYQTDFWQRTHYGFQRDTGHFLYQQAPSSSFTATLTFEGQYETLYDQAGLMLRQDEKHWIKCGIEHSDGMTNFSIVVTNGNSDWSVIAQPLVRGPQTVRVTLQNDAVIVHFLDQNGRWNLMRVTSFPVTSDLYIGPMACSPERSGFKAAFLDLDIQKAIDNPLHG